VSEPGKMRFDGRSWSVKPLAYTLGQRLLVLFSIYLMPLLTHVVISTRVNTWLWQILGCRVGRGTRIRTGTKINVPFHVTIGRDCLIHGQLKSRGGVHIGNGVELVEDVLLSTQSHNVDSVLFESVYEPVVVEDFCWLGPRAIVLPGVRLCEGTVVGANAVVTMNTEAWSVYVGVPAARIKSRPCLKLK
jgi:acetyltransferase-like isoleucine patch superfamily enzyme